MTADLLHGMGFFFFTAKYLDTLPFGHYVCFVGTGLIRLVL